MTPLEKITRLWTRTNDPHLARCGSVLIGQIKKEPEFTCICCLSPWVGIKQAAMHLFTMSKDPATAVIGPAGLPNLLSDLRRMVSAELAAPSVAALAAKLGGAGRNRTDDILLAKQTLSQLSYGPVPFLERMVGPGRLELPTSRLSGVRSNHLSYGPSGSRQRTGKLSRRTPGI